MTALAFDLGSVLVIGYCALMGYRHGLVLTMSDALFMIATLIVVLQWAPTLANRVTREFGASSILAVIGVTLAIVVLMDSARRLLGRAIKANLGRARRGKRGFGLTYHVLGVVPGTVRAVAAMALVSNIFLLQSPKQSALADFSLLTVGRALAAALTSGSVDGGQGFLIPGRTAGSTSLGPPVGEPSSLTVPFEPGTTGRLSLTAAADFLDMTNIARAQSGVSILNSEPSLDRIAEEHTLDMIHRAYFSHDSPDGRSPADRASAAGVGYRILAENIVFAPTLEAAFRSIMNSPAHRHNQLSPDFRRVGIGVATVDQGLMITVDFAD